MCNKRLLKFAHITLVCLLLSPFVALSSSETSFPSCSFPPGASFVPNEILIGVSPEFIGLVSSRELKPTRMGITALDHLNRKYGVQRVSPVFSLVKAHDPIAIKHALGGVFKLTVPFGTDIFAMIAEYEQSPVIAYAEPNRIYRISDFPNDTDFNKQWALHNTGQTGGTPDADIDAPEAWNIETGKPTVLIAILDTGVDYNHPDLAGSRVRIDIDKDFINSDDDAMDDHGHGTFCAGIAGANTNNARGIAGVCWGCQILPVKVLNSEGEGTAETVAQGIQYAAQVGAQIISMSLGYASDCGCSQTVARAINYAFEHGSLLVAASGNDYDKNRASYPASSPRVMAVGAIDHNDQETDFSNRDNYLDILAPGEDIYALDLNGGYYTARGTSAAAPHVSGVAGLIYSARPTLTNVEVWWILYQSAEDLSGARTSALPRVTVNDALEKQRIANLPFRIYLLQVFKMRSTAGRLNAYRALTLTPSGEMFAPVDTCSSEPDCPPGCSAEVVLAGEPTAIENLHLLRTFKDQALAHSPLGQRWITLYEHHRTEVASIFATDRLLRDQARLALKQWLPLIQTLSYPHFGEHVILAPEHLQAAKAVIEGLAARGSPQLCKDLEEVREILEKGQRLIGTDVGEAWRSLNNEFQ